MDKIKIFIKDNWNILRVIPFTNIHFSKSEPNEIAQNVFIHTIYVMVFICIFFFTYVTTVENDMVGNEINRVTKEILNDVDVLLYTAGSNCEAKQMLSTLLTPPDLTDADNDTVQKNNAVRNTAITFTLLIGLFLIYLLFCLNSLYKKNTNYHILLENLGLVTAVGLIEFSFLKLVVSQFVAIDTNNIKKIFYQALCNYKVTGSAKSDKNGMMQVVQFRHALKY